jgi:hypothetical protein
MKCVLLSVLLVLVIASASARNGVRSRYKTWSARFGKKNEDKATEEARLAVFEKNCDLIDEHNEKFLNGTASFYVDLNAHSALLDKERKNLKGFVLPELSSNKNKRGIGTQMIQSRAGVIYHPYHKSATAKVNAAKGINF